MEWVKEAFGAVNKGQIRDVPLPETIDLLVPNFGQSFGELEITLIDTKGVEDHAIREDLEARLKDMRTSVVFCSHFNDAPGPTAGSASEAYARHIRGRLGPRKGSCHGAALLRAGAGDEK